MIKHFVVVCYDVRNDRRRTSLHTLCAACQAKAEAIGGTATATEEEVFVV